MGRKGQGRWTQDRERTRALVSQRASAFQKWPHNPAYFEWGKPRTGTFLAF